MGGGGVGRVVKIRHFNKNLVTNTRKKIEYLIQIETKSVLFFTKSGQIF